MIEVSIAEFQRDIDRYQDTALTEPVAVTRDGRKPTVMISVEEYRRLRRHDRQVMDLGDFSNTDIAVLEKTHAPETARSFDDELTST